MVIALLALLKMNNHATKDAEAETSVSKETSVSTKAFVKAKLVPKERSLKDSHTKMSHLQFKIQVVLELLPQRYALVSPLLSEHWKSLILTNL